MSRFDPAPLLARLRPFQRATVDHVMARFDAGVRRFLVADEVGLGKTRVAQGVVAQILSRRNEDDRCDIIYVCSNGAIARQNLQILNILGDAGTLPTRLTLLNEARTTIRASGVNFISFTPGTSFDKTGGLGVGSERALIQNLLRGRIHHKRLSSLLHRPVRVSNWPGYLERAQPAPGLDRHRLADALLDGGMEQGILACDLSDVESRGRVVRNLRLRLARLALGSLCPRLVIFDEFQRFRDLFEDGANEAQCLMQDFLRQAEKDAHVLFLSATPYKMLTLKSDTAADGDHHTDFMKTIAVLYGDKGNEVSTQLAAEMTQFREQIRQVALGADHDAEHARNVVENRLRNVVSRNERVMTGSEDGGIRRRPVKVPVLADDLRQAKAVHDVALAIGARESAEYWKSAPYLFSFMGNYDLARRIGRFPGRAGLEGKAKAAMVPLGKKDRFAPIPPGNGRMRALVEEVLDKTDLHRRLWLPPSLGYLSGGPSLTKTLIFSDWQMVPEAVAAMLSYEAERRIRAEAGLKGAADRKTDPAVRLTLQEGGASASLRALLLFYPSDFLARVVDPLAIWREHGALSLCEMLAEAERRIRHALRDQVLQHGEIEIWQIVAALDRQANDDKRRNAIAQGLAAGARRGEAEGSGDVAAEIFRRFMPPAEDPARLASADEIGLLARIALGSPAICLLRAFRRHVEVPESELAFMSALAARGFQTLFNHREVQPLIGGATSDRWLAAMDYCAGQDLQAVLDEYVFQLCDGQLFPGAETDEGDPAHRQLAQGLRDTIGLRSAPITLHNPFRERRGGSAKMASHLAVRFAASAARKAAEDGGVTRIDHLRDAFNSPFRPFVLASTSIGQEGLDFHRYCHRIWHWNLPGNPVDLEQREGRVQRYLNHAVRLNIAASHAEQGRRGKGPAWPAMVMAAERAVNEAGTSARGLRPHWLYEGGAAQPVQIETVLPLPPLSREERGWSWLERMTAIYRLAFGQPRQSDLLSILDQPTMTAEMRDKILIRLAPPEPPDMQGKHPRQAWDEVQ